MTFIKCWILSCSRRGTKCVHDILNQVNIFMKNTYREKIFVKLNQKKSRLCVGLDSDIDKIPSFFGHSIADKFFLFNKTIIDSTHDLAVAFKINPSFYLEQGKIGLDAIKKTTDYILQVDNMMPIIVDSKLSEFGRGGDAMATFYKDLGFDAVMVVPWFGTDLYDSLINFNKNLGIIIHAHDSNQSCIQVQDLKTEKGTMVYEQVILDVLNRYDIAKKNIFFEAPATYPKSLQKIRKLIGEDEPIIIAGIGPQGGSMEAILENAGKDGKRIFANSSRGIIFSGLGTNDSESYGARVRKNAIATNKMLFGIEINK